MAKPLECLRKKIKSYTEIRIAIIRKFHCVLFDKFDLLYLITYIISVVSLIIFLSLYLPLLIFFLFFFFPFFFFFYFSYHFFILWRHCGIWENGKSAGSRLFKNDQIQEGSMSDCDIPYRMYISFCFFPEMINTNFSHTVFGKFYFVNF